MEDKLVTELRGLIADINVAEIVSHIEHGSLIEWIQTWSMQSNITLGFLNELLLKYKEEAGYEVEKEW
jgi:hypothetical protein